MKTSVVIPTWKRVEFLQLALRGLSNQTLRPDEVILGVRHEDVETLEYLNARNDDGLSIKVVRLDEPGVVASMQAAVDASSGDCVCLLDDDAEPAGDWLARIVTCFEANPAFGAVGGRDLLMYLPEEERDLSLSPKVGIITKTGKSYGNHHCGKGGLRKVDFLKGCNCAFRGDLLRSTPFDRNLRGSGAQFFWEFALCLDCAAKGHAIAYDPNILVKHHVAPRHGSNEVQRGGYSQEWTYDHSYNVAYTIYSRLRGMRRAGYLIRNTLIGSRANPGLAQWLRLSLQKSENACLRWKTAQKGRMDGIRAARDAIAASEKQKAR